MKGLLASVLGIKPIIGVEKELGKYAQMGQARTLNQAIGKIVDIIGHQYPPRHGAARPGHARRQSRGRACSARR